MIHSKRGARVSVVFSRPRRSPVALLLLGLIALAACGKASAEPTGYFAQTTYRIVFIEWSQSSTSASSDVTLKGTITQSLVDLKKFKLNNDAAAFNGTLKDSNVSLALTRPLDSATTWTGTLSGSDLTLNYTNAEGSNIPVHLKAAPRATFNTALVQEQHHLSDLQAGHVTGQTDDQIKAGIDKVSKSLSADLAKLSKDSAAMNDAVATVTAASDSTERYKTAAHSAMKSAGSHKWGPQVCPFASSASSNAGAASGASAAAAAAKENVGALISVVKADLLQVGSEHGNLVELQTSLPSYKPKGVPSDKDVTDAITAANTAMETADQGANGAARAAASKASLAQSYAAQAQAKCAAAPTEKPSPSPRRTRDPSPDPSPSPS
jgi:hypothetical protein